MGDFRGEGGWDVGELGDYVSGGIVLLVDYGMC